MSSNNKTCASTANDNSIIELKIADDKDQTLISRLTAELPTYVETLQIVDLQGTNRSEFNKNLTDEIFKLFAPFKNLRQFKLSRAPKVSGSGLKYLIENASSTLEVLELKECMMMLFENNDQEENNNIHHNKDLQHLHHFTSLTSLTLSWCESLSDEDLNTHVCNLIENQNKVHQQQQNNGPKLKSLILSGYSQLTDAGLAFFGKNNNNGIEELKLSKNRNFTGLRWNEYFQNNNNNNNSSSSSSTKLRILNLDECVGMSDFSFLKNLASSLVELKTDDGSREHRSFLRLSDDSLEHFSELTHLKLLDLGKSNELITDVGISAHFSKLSGLELLLLSNNRNITGAGWSEGLKNLSSLKLLDLSGCSSMNDFEFLRGKGNIVDIKGQSGMYAATTTSNEAPTTLFRNLTDESLANLSDLFSLKRLDLSTTSSSSTSPITDKGLIHLSNLTGLEELTFENNQNITGAGFENYFEKLNRSLKSLNFSKCSKMQHFTFLQKVAPCLLGLNLSHCELITDDALKNDISTCTKLMFLDLQGTTRISAGEGGLSFLAKSLSSCLKELYLQGCNKSVFEKNSLMFLKELKALKHLHVDSSEVVVSDEAKRELQSVILGLTVW